MLAMTDQLHSKNLVPFKKRRGVYTIPGMTAESDERSLEHLDHDLSPEEQRFIRHYVGYADTLLKSATEQDLAQQGDAAAEEKRRVTEIPGPGRKKATNEAA